MDPTLATLLPTGGVATVLLAVIVYLLRQNHLDRAQYRADVAAVDARATAAAAAQEARHVAEMSAQEARHAAAIAGFGHKIERLEESNAKVLAAYEGERERRWKAEDAAVHYRQLAEKGQAL